MIAKFEYATSTGLQSNRRAAALYIQELQVGSFRLLKDTQFGPFREPINPSELVILAGPNGGGKSSVLELLSQALTSQLGWQYWHARGSSDQRYALKIGLTPAEIDELIAKDFEDRLPESGQPVAAVQRNTKLEEYLATQRGFWIENNLPRIPTGYGDVNSRASNLTNRLYSTFERKLGFFIRSERSYSPRGYNYGNMAGRSRRFQPNHFNSFSFNSTENQYNEIYEFLIEQSYDYTRQLGEYQKAIIRRERPQFPADPIEPYNQLLNRIFPGYSFVDDVDESHLTLRVKLPTGNIIQFQELSSGEKEVFFVLALFRRHEINNSIIVIDEPELHLHPELARKMIRAMRTIQPQNQIWCATHSAELIDEAGRERTYFLSPSEDRTRSICIPATAEKAELTVLRDMYGYSGFVGLSKKVIFSEGIQSSADRKTFTNLFPDKADEIKIIPAGSFQELYRVNAAVLSLLESDFARCEFYLIRDHDYLSAAAVAKHKSQAPGRLFVLKRYHIENYLLSDDIISFVLEHFYQKKMSPVEVNAEFLTIAREMSAAVLRDLAVSRINKLFQSEDASVGNHSSTFSIVDVARNRDATVITNLRQAILTKANSLSSQVAARTAQPEYEKVFDECANLVTQALSSNDWRDLFPGRALLQKFSSKNGLGDWPVLQNLIIEQMSKSPSAIPVELKDIFNSISP